MQVSAAQVPEYTAMRLSHADVVHRLAVITWPVVPVVVYQTAGCDWATPQVVVPSTVPVLVAFTVVPAVVLPQATACALQTRSFAGAGGAQLTDRLKLELDVAPCTLM
jgi:hypothetical protein